MGALRWAGALRSGDRCRRGPVPRLRFLREEGARHDRLARFRPAAESPRECLRPTLGCSRGRLRGIRRTPVLEVCRSIIRSNSNSNSNSSRWAAVCLSSSLKVCRVRCPAGCPVAVPLLLEPAWRRCSRGRELGSH